MVVGSQSHGNLAIILGVTLLFSRKVPEVANFPLCFVGQSIGCFGDAFELGFALQV